MSSQHSDFSLGYVMGLIVSMGSFTGDWRNPCLQIKLHQRDIAVLESLRQTLGGKIYGPYQHSDRCYAMWLLRGEELEQAIPLFVQYLPESHRRRQFVAWLNKYPRWREHYISLTDTTHCANAAT
jgi:hypothetical protein